MDILVRIFKTNGQFHCKIKRIKQLSKRTKISFNKNNLLFKMRLVYQIDFQFYCLEFIRQKSHTNFDLSFQRKSKNNIFFFGGGPFSWRVKVSSLKTVIIPYGLMRSFAVKENHISFVVNEILTQYIYTPRQPVIFILFRITKFSIFLKFDLIL